MWEHVCTIEDDGVKCTERSTVATQCFRYGDEKFDRAIWVETCEIHSWECSEIVSILDVSVYSK
jgi:hypothetical protein